MPRATISRRFLRAIRLDTDLGNPEALQGFVCPASFSQALVDMGRQIRESGHAAFTWTGPFGSGKSSLAVVLAALLHPDPEQRGAAASLIGHEGSRAFRELDSQELGYATLGVTGRRANCETLIAEALHRSRLCEKPAQSEDQGESLLASLLQVARCEQRAGLLILIDELGQVLEAAGKGQGDLHFLQDLAEHASRSRGRLIVVGILHQSFAEYVGKLASRTREEWLKIQGRFIDVPLTAAPSEHLALLAAAIQSRPAAEASAGARRLASAINERRRVPDPHLEDHLRRCWPLNPVTAGLLGPSSRRRFGQNQRSLFSFLNSSEPRGFQEFLQNTPETEDYLPHMYWDYLQANMGPAILASPDGHRWATAENALERCYAKCGGGGELPFLATKTVALIDLLRDQAGFDPTREVLQLALPRTTSAELDQVLKDLQRWSIVVFRRHLDAYGIFAGSDFDLEAALEEERGQNLSLDPNALSQLAGLRPVVATRHYHQTGALRWLRVELTTASQVSARVTEFVPDPGCIGLFLLAIPEVHLPVADLDGQLAQSSRREIPGACILAGTVSDGDLLADWAADLVALESIRSGRTELQGDAVARQEVAARFETVRSRLQGELQRAFTSARWYSQGREIELKGTAAIRQHASHLANEFFPLSPKLHNELLNRQRPSANAVAGRRNLLYAMAQREGQEQLGIRGFPVERGLLQSLLVSSGLYRRHGTGESAWRLQPPRKADPCRLVPLWQRTDEVLQGSPDSPTSMRRLYAAWMEPPYGVKAGLLPILALAYVLSRRDCTAVYLDGMFRPDIDDFLVDRLQQDADSVQLRHVILDGTCRKVLAGLEDVLSEYDGTAITQGDSLETSRRLVAAILRLPRWTLHTDTVGQDARKLRRLVLGASDPNRLLFDDLPSWAGVGSSDITTAEVQTVIDSLRCGLLELVTAYARMLEELRSLLFTELEVDEDHSQLACRARVVQGLTGDLRLDAFAARLQDFDGTDQAVEGIVGLAISKPPREWGDRDLDSARVEIAFLARKFRRSEIYAAVKGRSATRHALAIAAGFSGGQSTVVQEFEISAKEASSARRLARSIRRLISDEETRQEVLLAALAQVGTGIMRDLGRRVPAADSGPMETQ